MNFHDLIIDGIVIGILIVITSYIICSTIDGISKTGLSKFIEIIVCKIIDILWTLFVLLFYVTIQIINILFTLFILIFDVAIILISAYILVNFCLRHGIGF